MTRSNIDISTCWYIQCFLSSIKEFYDSKGENNIISCKVQHNKKKLISIKQDLWYTILTHHPVATVQSHMAAPDHILNWTEALSICSTCNMYVTVSKPVYRKHHKERSGIRSSAEHIHDEQTKITQKRANFQTSMQVIRKPAGAVTAVLVFREQTKRYRNFHLEQNRAK